MKSFAGKIAVVTGGGSGMGRELALQLAARGCDVAISGIHPFLSRINSPARVCDLPGAEEPVRRIAQQQLFENYQIADDLLAGREWFFDHFTAVDAHFFWCFRRGTQFNLDVSRLKNCIAHFERIKQRPSVRKLLSYEQEVQTAFAQAA